MNVTYIQTNLHWEDCDKNLASFSSHLNSISEATDLIVLPEMFSTGFTMKPEVFAEESGGKALAWLKQKAGEKNCVITGSLSVKENGRYYNRLFWVRPDGSYNTYDKRHLFSMGNEDQHYTAGNDKQIMELKGLKICPLICYDLRFPVWSRNKFDKNTKTWDYDVLVYLANWPEARAYPWKQLLIARAIENQCYLIGVNRVGKDGNDYQHAGDSMVINPKGEILSRANSNEECIETIQLDKKYLDEFRKNFPVGFDADEFEIIG